MFTCPRCGMTSFNQRDALEGYCANCRDITVGRIDETPRERSARLADFERTAQSLSQFERVYRQLQGALQSGAITMQDFSAAVGRLANMERDVEAEMIGVSGRVGPGEAFATTSNRVEIEPRSLTLDTLRAAMDEIRRAGAEPFDPPSGSAPAGSVPWWGARIERTQFERDQQGSDAEDARVAIGALLTRPSYVPSAPAPPAAPQALPPEPTRRKIVL